MSYLKFDRSLLTNLEKSLDKEMLRTNRAGAYASTTIIDCNTRKYHGLLVVPVPNLDRDNHILLSSLDETVIQHGAEFNLGIHRYQGGHYSPAGHKYIREFDIDRVATTIYRVGGVVLKKERILVTSEDRVLVRYTLLEAHSPTTIRFRPYLAFRNAHKLSKRNDNAYTNPIEIENGVGFTLYNGYPQLSLQFNKQVNYVHQPDWYCNIEYTKEMERGYDFKEDLMVPGYFEMSIKKGEVIVFSAGTSECTTRSLKQLFDKELSMRATRQDFRSCLKIAAEQFYNKKEGGYYLLAGYPWFKYRARDWFNALPGCTLSAGNVKMFDNMMILGVKAIYDFLNSVPKTTEIKEVSAPDVVLDFIWAIQKYAEYTSLEEANKKYGKVVMDIIEFIRKKHHPKLQLHDNGLVWVNGTDKPATWMNATENGYPITPRTGYVVEINALWYNALRFAAELATTFEPNTTKGDLLNYQAEILSKAFEATFWNGTYLFDYVDGEQKNWEVRPNMIFAVSLPYSPLPREKQKAVVDIVTKELWTIKGLRSLSPKSPNYRNEYIGGEQERNRNYHNGPIWPWTTAAFIEAYLKVYKLSGISFALRMMAGLEVEMKDLTIGSLSELFDGNPPYRGHGAMSYAMTVGEVLRAMDVIDEFLKENTQS